MESRKFAIADIHGCCRTLRALLNQINLNKGDTIYLLGDYIDRGPDSKGVLDIILELHSGEFNICPLMGNHEAMLLQAIDGNYKDLHFWLENGGASTLKSYGVAHPSDINGSHIDFIRSLPFNHRTDSHILVHAGLNFCLEDPFCREGEQAMLWGRCQVGDLGKQMGRKLVTGHTIRHIDEIRRSLKKPVICLDNGCHMGASCSGYGALAAMELATGQLWLQDNCEGSY